MKYPSLLAALLATSLLIPASCGAQDAPKPDAATPAKAAPAPLNESFRLGQKLVINGRTLYVASIGDKLTLIPPQTPTATIGSFITPVDVAASTQNRPARALIDSVGFNETFPGSGVWVHTNDVYLGGASMWNGFNDGAFVAFDLGEDYNVGGLYVWNYNEGGQWLNRGIREAMIQWSDDGEKWTDVGKFSFDKANGSGELLGQPVKFEKPVKARYFRINSLGNYGENETGLAEIRFANADKPYEPPSAFKPRYPRPQLTVLPLGQPMKGAENIVFPEGTGGIIDVTKAPYNAKGDGVTDDTDAIQKALSDNPNRQAVIYLPNGVYLVSRQLRWGGPDDMRAGDAAKYIILQGQSRAGTVIKLKDAAPQYDNPGSPRGVIWTGAAPAQRFGNEVRNLTVDTGVDNPGAAGLQFIANNQGGVYDVSIQSGDGQGTSGLDMAYTNEEGPLLIKNVSVKGFDVGVATANSVASITMENVSVEDQNTVGFRNNGQPISVRKFQSKNSVPAVINGSGLMTLIDSTLTGTGTASDETAMLNTGTIYVRNLQTSGYKIGLDDKSNNKTFDVTVTEYSSTAPHVVLASAQSALKLPIEETPTVPWDDPKTWAMPEQFGGKVFDGQDDSAAIQKAIDSGATTVYLRAGDWQINSTVVIRGKVRHLVGEGWIKPGGDITAKNDPVFRFADGDAPVVVVERFATDFTRGQFPFMENDSKRTLVMKNLAINLHTGVMDSTCYRNTDNAIGGKVFIEDCVGSTWRFKGQSVWARQLNGEGHGYKVTNDGGKLWILGLKTESVGGVLMTTNGGQTEVLGGMSQTNGGFLEPMFTNINSSMSVYFAEQNNSDQPYTQLVVAQKGDQKAAWDTPDKGFKGFRPVFYEGRLAK